MLIDKHGFACMLQTKKGTYYYVPSKYFIHRVPPAYTGNSQ